MMLILISESINLLEMNRSFSPSKKDHVKAVQNIRYPLVQRMSHGLSPKKGQYYQHKITIQPSSELLSFLIMKEKHLNVNLFHDNNSLDQQEDILKLSQSHLDKRKGESLPMPIKILPFNSYSDKEVKKIRKSLYESKTKLQGELQINTVSEGCSIRRISNPLNQIQLIKRTRYQKRLEPLKLNLLNKKMSNNIRDYISVERISLKEVEDSYAIKSKMYQKYHLDLLLNKEDKLLDKDNHRDLQATTSYQLKKKFQNMSPEKNVLKRKAVFKLPFSLYYYRDFIWKVAYSNGHIVQVPDEYDQKIKFYVGPGNNSNLIKGIIKRRTWFQQTDKASEAQFIWTQLKTNSIFSQQKSGQKVKSMMRQQRKQEIKLMLSKQHSLKKQEYHSRKYKLLNQVEQLYWNKYWSNNIVRENQMKVGLQGRSKHMQQQEIQLSKRQNFKIHNHFCNNFIIGNKKALFKTMSEYYLNAHQDVFQNLPLTFHIKEGLEDEAYLIFLQHFYAIAKQNKANPNHSINKFNAWIVKPGENTNRGNGIIVCLSLNEIKTILKSKEKHHDGTTKTYILQKYIERPLLYKRRKFDLRHYMMINCINGRMKGYWYRQGYVRTTSSQYTLKASDGSIHLTNDAVQKHLPDYGKFERGNKITYEQLDAYISKQDSSFNFFAKIYPRMREIATDAIKASALNIDPLRKNHNFQIFGLDFMIDQHYNVWLIQINTNPCLQTGCPVLLKIIPKFIENTIEICLDPLFPAPLTFAPKLQEFSKNLNEQNNYDLVFDQRIDGIVQVSNNVLDNPEQDDDIFDDDGQDFN